MSSGSHERHLPWRRCWSLRLVASTFVVLSYGSMYSQTTSTGALTGVSVDSSGAVLPGVFFTSQKRMVLKRTPSPRTTMVDSISYCCNLGFIRCRLARLASNP
jgi:Mn2+/Fe2+ NRAMP family transporter